MPFSFIKSKLLKLNHNKFLSYSSTNTQFLFPITRRTTPLSNQPFYTLGNVGFLLNNRNASLSSSYVLSNPNPNPTRKIINMNNNTRCWFQRLLKGCKSRWLFPVAALVGAISLIRFERVPFTDQNHLVLAWPRLLTPVYLINQFSDLLVYAELRHDKGKYPMLPPTNPRTIRVTNIVREIVQAMHSTLGLNKYSFVKTYKRPFQSFDTPLTQFQIGSHTYQSSKFDSSDGKYRRRHGTKHLENREWKVAVIDSPSKDAGLLPNCTIFVHTGLLDTLSDGGLALVIGHEVGHYIARHIWVPAVIWFAIDKLIIQPLIKLVDLLAPQFSPPSERRRMLAGFLSSPDLQRQEFEADYIGMMLMALAGYDPQVAFEIFIKCWDEKTYLSSHPSSLERIESLQRPGRMKKAMDIYRKVQINQESKNK